MELTTLLAIASPILSVSAVFGMFAEKIATVVKSAEKAHDRLDDHMRDHP